MPELFEALISIFSRAYEIGQTVMTPVPTLLYASCFFLILLAYIKKSHRFGVMLLHFTLVLFFFIIWNHPAFRYFKFNPWHGGYAYVFIMLAVMIYIPIRLIFAFINFWQDYLQPIDRI